MLKPLINWDEIEKLTRSKSEKDQKQGSIWDDRADFYNKMAMMELTYTEKQLDCLDITKEDTVLDIGCGPGRISILAAMRAGKVTAVDASKKMLAYCRQNAKDRDLTNLNIVLNDWDELEAQKNMPKHDFVIASRTSAIGNVEKLSSFANKCAAIVIWANAPSIPELMNQIFGNTNGGKSVRPIPDRRISYNIIYNKVYDLGYEPNVKILTDGFCKLFLNRQEAYAFLISLRPEIPQDKMEAAKQNLDNYLIEKQDGKIEFRVETRSCVIWWDTRKLI